jgi:hypothetical protein
MLRWLSLMPMGAVMVDRPCCLLLEQGPFTIASNRLLLQLSNARITRSAPGRADSFLQLRIASAM